MPPCPTAVNWGALAEQAFDLAARWAVIEQARKVNRKRGAWRRPALTRIVARLERELKSAYDEAEHGIALALAGVQTQATEAERKAVAHHGLDEIDPDEPARADTLAAILILLGLFRARHLELTNAAIEEAFTLGRTRLLKRLKREGAAEQPGTMALLPQTKNRFEGDSQRLYQDLLHGSKRTPDGVEEIADVSRYTTVGAQVAALRTLFEGEEFRLSLLAEHATWWSWQAGYRAGAIDGTIAAIAAGEEPMRFRWSGPNDSKACAPCKAAFLEPDIIASSLQALASPSERCLYGVNCRHFYKVIG